MRLHRSLRKKLNKIDPAKVANKAEDYLAGTSLYRADLKGITGLVSNERMKKCVKKIDMLEREMIKLEEKIEKVAKRRAAEALKLEEYLLENLDLLAEYFEPDELRDFK